MEGAGRGEQEQVRRGGRADPPAQVASTRRGGGREVGVARRGVGGGGKGCAREPGGVAVQGEGEPEWVAGESGAPARPFGPCMHI